MSNDLIREQRLRVISIKRQLREENQKWPVIPTPVPKAQWGDSPNPNRFQVWRSNRFLVQGFHEHGGIIRLTVNRSWIDNAGEWEDGITWEELQLLKNQCGFAPFDAVEIFPRADDVVEVANMRHLWVMPQPLDYAWRNRLVRP